MQLCLGECFGIVLNNQLFTRSVIGYTTCLICFKFWISCWNLQQKQSDKQGGDFKDGMSFLRDVAQCILWMQMELSSRFHSIMEKEDTITTDSWKKNSDTVTITEHCVTCFPKRRWRCYVILHIHNTIYVIFLNDWKIKCFGDGIFTVKVPQYRYFL